MYKNMCIKVLKNTSAKKVTLSMFKYVKKKKK